MHRTKRKLAIVGVIALLICLFLGVLLLAAWTRPYIHFVDSDGNSSTMDQGVLESLIILDRAPHVQLVSGRHGIIYVSYVVEEEYPASDAIGRVSSRLESLGWQPLEESWLIPQSPTSHVQGWQQEVRGDFTPPQMLHTWSGEWKDRNGNLITYTFSYAYPCEGQPDRESLHISGMWYPAERVVSMQQMLPDTNLGGN
jgi:hypothetical protein